MMLGMSLRGGIGRHAVFRPQCEKRDGSNPSEGKYVNGRGDRVAKGASLLKKSTHRRTEGSNPFLSD